MCCCCCYYYVESSIHIYSRCHSIYVDIRDGTKRKTETVVQIRVFIFFTFSVLSHIVSPLARFFIPMNWFLWDRRPKLGIPNMWYKHEICPIYMFFFLKHVNAPTSINLIDTAFTIESFPFNNAGIEIRSVTKAAISKRVLASLKTSPRYEHDYGGYGPLYCTYIQMCIFGLR